MSIVKAKPTSPGRRFVVSIKNDHLHKGEVGSSRVDLQACKLEYSIVSPK